MRPLFLAAIVLALTFPAAGWARQKTRGKSEGKSAPTAPTQIGGKTLAQWLQDIANKDPSKAERAIRTVPHFDPERAARALPAVVALLKRHSARYHLDNGVRANATLALGILLARSANPDRKEFQKCIALLKSLLSDSQSIVKYRAAEALGRIGPRAAVIDAKILDRLVVVSHDKDAWETRLAAVVALGTVGYAGKNGPRAEVTRALCKALRDPAWQVRLNAAQALGWLGAPATVRLEALRALNEASERDAEGPVRLTAHVAYLKVKGKADGAHLVGIGKFLTNEDALLRVKAAEFLGAFGTKAKSEDSRLIEGLKDPDFQVVAMCIWALGRVEGKTDESHLAALAKFLQSDEAVQRARAVQFLGSLGAPAKSQIPRLIDALKDADAHVVVSAVHALAQLGDTAAEAIPHLEKMTKDNNRPQDYRQLAAEAIKVIRTSGQSKSKGK